jgi:tRNA modification GTPase
MFSTSDTIVAVATPPGRGGIGVVRISGPDARAIAGAVLSHGSPLEPRRATWTTARRLGRPSSPARSGAGAAGEQGAGAAIDEVIATFFPGPRSYTGDDLVEVSAHGSPVILRAIVCASIDAGARLAEPGEFTLRAFLAGRIDLLQAEAVADLVDAVTPLQARVAFDQLQGTLTGVIAEIDAALFDLIARLEASVDFPEEGYHFLEPGALAGAIDRLRERTTALLASARRGRLVREGLQVAIVGRPNAGKSSLFNALAGASRAIVTDVPGTTRDLVTEVVDLDGLRVTLVDTAGLREAGDPIEAEGVSRSRQAQRAADVVVVVLDRAEPLAEADLDIIAARADRRVVVANKMDKPAAWRLDALERAGCDAIEMSAATGEGLERLRERLGRALGADCDDDRPAITNVRHEALVRRADEALGRARTAALADGASLSEEFVLADLQDARDALEEITGRRVTDDLLAQIFGKFCIGK